MIYDYYQYFLPLHMFGFLFMILFLGLLMYGVLFLFKHSSHDKNSSLDILKERYAKGEITKEEFKVIKKEIE